MKLAAIKEWIDNTLDVNAYNEVSNNGIQIAREGDEITKVAFGVDASVRFMKAAADVGAQLCVVHHGISWGGGIKRVTGSEYNVISQAIRSNLALYAAHLPLDANRKYGNNFELARYFGLKNIKPAFSYHGYVIGCTGMLANGEMIGVCSGGAGEFAVEAKELGCSTFITGEASWGDVIAAENVGIQLVCGGHYETETFGVNALARAMKKELGIQTVFIGMEEN